jgi:3-deoxy-D-manno-octulosonate 8-phosphate phosphatase (KDO 8-P phosphatase)
MTEGSAKGINATQQVIERAKKIKLILMDVDGTFTDGRMTYFPDSTGKMVEFKFFSSHDGLAAHFCNSVGIKTGFISGLQSPAVEERARILGMTYVKQGHLEKEKVWEEVLADAKLTPEQAAFIGDDLTDLGLILKAGLGCAVADARKEVRQHADYVTDAPGGHGAFREVVELILKSQDKWKVILDKYNVPQAKVSIGF